MPIIALLVWLVILCLVYWAATRLMAAFGIGEPIATVVVVVIVVFAVWTLLGVLGALPGGVWRLR